MMSLKVNRPRPIIPNIEYPTSKPYFYNFVFVVSAFDNWDIIINYVSFEIQQLSKSVVKKIGKKIMSAH